MPDPRLNRDLSGRVDGRKTHEHQKPSSACARVAKGTPTTTFGLTYDGVPVPDADRFSGLRGHERQASRTRLMCGAIF